MTATPALETAMARWMAARGLCLRPVSDAERRAARKRLTQTGDLNHQRALRILALWSLAPEALARPDPITVKDLGLFLSAEGFALEDAYGLRALGEEDNPSC